MPVMNFDLEDGLPPVSFNLKEQDCKRFMDFMSYCDNAIKSQEMLSAAPTPPEVEPVAMTAEFKGLGIVTLRLDEMDNELGMRFVPGTETKYYTSPPSPKADWFNGDHFWPRPTPPEVEPVAYGAKGTVTDKWYYIWHTKEDVANWINLSDMSEGGNNYVGPVPLYTSPPSPKAEAQIAERIYPKEPKWDADGNPLNLEAAARDMIKHLRGSRESEKAWAIVAADNLRKFFPEGK